MAVSLPQMANAVLNRERSLQKKKQFTLKTYSHNNCFIEHTDKSSGMFYFNESSFSILVLNKRSLIQNTRGYLPYVQFKL